MQGGIYFPCENACRKIFFVFSTEQHHKGANLLMKNYNVKPGQAEDDQGTVVSTYHTPVLVLARCVLC